MEGSLIAVADTSPINYLVRLGYSELLPELYSRVLIPPAVSRELAHPGAPAEVQRWMARRPSWLEVSPVSFIDPTLPLKLGSGELEAISLAVEKKNAVLVIDDFHGRSEAQARNVPVVGTLFLILEAAVRDRLNLNDCLLQLRHLGFRFSRAVEDDMRERHAKRKAL